MNIYPVHEFIDSLPSMNIEKILKKSCRRTEVEFPLKTEKYQEDVLNKSFEIGVVLHE